MYCHMEIACMLWKKSSMEQVWLAFLWIIKKNQAFYGIRKYLELDCATVRLSGTVCMFPDILEEHSRG